MAGKSKRRHTQNDASASSAGGAGAPNDLEERIARNAKDLSQSVTDIGSASGCAESFGMLEDFDHGAVLAMFAAIEDRPVSPGSAAIVVDSPGGDIHIAYLMARLLRRRAVDRLTFIVPRWAKSAATLFCCAGDTILLSPVGELGPLDPQLIEDDRQHDRHERFSPLHIASTLDLIRSEYERGRPDMGKALIERLQYPMTLGRYTKLIDVGRIYTEKLLKTRMLKSEPENATRIAAHLSVGYPDHGYCIHLEEAQELGLKVEEMSGDVLSRTRRFITLRQEEQTLADERMREQMQKRISAIPPELLDRLLPIHRGLQRDEGEPDGTNRTS